MPAADERKQVIILEKIVNIYGQEAHIPRACPQCGSANLHIAIDDDNIACYADDKHGNPSCDWQTSIDWFYPKNK